MTKEEYNAVPVYYCKRCLSLRILDVEYLENSDYCEECGSTDVGKCSIEEWESMYKERYGHSFLTNY